MLNFHNKVQLKGEEISINSPQNGSKLDIPLLMVITKPTKQEGNRLNPHTTNYKIEPTRIFVTHHHPSRQNLWTTLTGYFIEKFKNFLKAVAIVGVTRVASHCCKVGLLLHPEIMSIWRTKGNVCKNMFISLKKNMILLFYHLHSLLQDLNYFQPLRNICEQWAHEETTISLVIVCTKIVVKANIQC